MKTLFAKAQIKTNMLFKYDNYKDWNKIVVAEEDLINKSIENTNRFFPIEFYLRNIIFNIFSFYRFSIKLVLFPETFKINS